MDDKELLDKGLGFFAGYSNEQQLKHTVNKINKDFEVIKKSKEELVNHGSGLIDKYRQALDAHIAEVREFREQLARLRDENRKGSIRKDKQEH